jgi:peptidyl-prolyl cis-trans isomerase SurA
MKIIVTIFLILFSLIFAIPSQGEVVDRIIAIVNDDIITLKEVESYVHVEKRNQFTSIDEYLRNLQLKERLDFFISSLLIKQQAKKLKIDVSDKEVESIIENIKKQNLITEIELKEQLKKDKITYDNFVEGIRLNVLRSRVLARVVSPDVRVTDATLKEYYDKHKDEYRDMEYHLKQIFISGQRGDGSQRAANAYKLLDQGKKFEDVALEFSDDPSGKQGGDIGFVKVEELLPALKESVKLLVPNTYTNAVQTPYGFHILKLIEIKKTDLAPFETLKDKIHEQIVLQESEKRYNEYINKLRQASYIEVKI